MCESQRTPGPPGATRVSIRPGLGWKLRAGVFGVDPELEGVAAHLDVLLGDGEPLAVGDADHLLDQIDAGHLFGHRVLHLDPRVDLDEVEAALLVEDELDRARRLVVRGAGETNCRLPHRLLGLRIENRTRALFEELLVATLDRAVALTEVHDVAVLVGDHLHLDVTRALDELLHVDHVVAEARERFRLGRMVGGDQLIRIVNDPHTAAAAPPAAALIKTG